MKKIIFTISAILFFSSLFAQDFIYKNDGNEIKSKVIEITPDYIKYKKWSNQSGPIYNIKISDVFMVVYENGEKEVFETNEVQKHKQKPVQQQPIKQDVKQAVKQPVKQAVQPSEISKEFKRNFQIGLTLGFNIASVNYNYEDKDDEPVGGILYGLTEGLTVNYHFNKNFALQSGVYLMGKGNNANLEKTYEKDLQEQYPGQESKIEGSYKITLSYLQIPLTFNFVIPLHGKDNSVLIGPGVYFAYAVAGKKNADYSISVMDRDEWIIVLEDYNDSNVELVSTIPFNGDESLAYYKPIDMGVVINIGIKSNKFMLSSITSIGLLNTTPPVDLLQYIPVSDKVTNICGTIALTYFFN